MRYKKFIILLFLVLFILVAVLVIVTLQSKQQSHSSQIPKRTNTEVAAALKSSDPTLPSKYGNYKILSIKQYDGRWYVIEMQPEASDIYPQYYFFYDPLKKGQGLIQVDPNDSSTYPAGVSELPYDVQQEVPLGG